MEPGLIATKSYESPKKYRTGTLLIAGFFAGFLTLAMGIGMGLLLASWRRTAPATPSGKPSPPTIPATPPARFLSVSVLDPQHRPIAHAVLDVFPADSPAPTQAAQQAGVLQPSAELGVLRGPLPFPQDIIQGNAKPAQTASPLLTTETDSAGMATLTLPSTGLFVVRLRGNPAPNTSMLISSTPTGPTLTLRSSR